MPRQGENRVLETKAEDARPIKADVESKSKPKVLVGPNHRLSSSVYETSAGQIFCGDSKKVLKTKKLKARTGDVQLVFTSPPYPLTREKSYGNAQGKEYISWLAGFARQLTSYLKEDGSIVIELGNGWEQGVPVMSTVSLRALMKFLERGGLHLCQEFVWYNPARLPSPAEWVNVRRIRVKDSFTRFWWMSPTPFPKASNKNVLRQYSKSMEILLDKQSYNAGSRPSEHQIGETSFLTNNGGAIPSNVLDGDEIPNIFRLANTRATDSYQSFCRTQDIKAHPARMPIEIADFFIQFLTEENDLILDPFAGSNTTGRAAENSGRRWISIEKDWNSVAGSISRFSLEELEKIHPRVSEQLKLDIGLTS